MQFTISQSNRRQANICTNDGVGYQCIYSSLGCNELIKILIKQSEAEKKYPPFCRRNFQILIHCMNSVVLWLSLYSHKTCILIIKNIPNACLKFYKDKMPRATRVEQVGSHDDVIKWKLFPRYWPCARGIHRSPVNSPHKASDHGLWFFFDLSLNKLLSKQLWGWWFETPWHSLWRHCNGVFHQNRPYLHVLVVSTGQPLIRSIILYSCISNIQENDIKWYMVMYSTICASHTINCTSTLLMVFQMWI